MYSMFDIIFFSSSSWNIRIFLLFLERRLQDLITHNTEPGCLNKLQTFCEGM